MVARQRHAAVVYLSEAYQIGASGETLRFLLKQAMRAVDGQRVFLHGHQVVFSPDGLSLGTASEDGAIRVWDAATGHLLATLQGAVFSPDGQRLAAASEDGARRVWDAATGHLLATLEGHQASLGAVVFSPDGQRLATASGGTARMWDVSLETRSTETIAALVRCKGLWHLDEGRLLPANPDPATCSRRSPAQ